jgi:hypothetical protein
LIRIPDCEDSCEDHDLELGGLVVRKVIFVILVSFGYLHSIHGKREPLDLLSLE